jgi:hypothetical protein
MTISIIMNDVFDKWKPLPALPYLTIPQVRIYESTNVQTATTVTRTTKKTRTDPRFILSRTQHSTLTHDQEIASISPLPPFT